MRKQFSLFQSHIDLAHHYWRQILRPGDIALDATCGNGHDTLFLSECVLTPDSGCLYSIDVQENAILSAKEKLEGYLSQEQLHRVKFFRQCHSTFPAEIQPESVKCIVYNLGYLPKGDKALTTKVETTLQSVTQAMTLLIKGGVISITCYPGHDEGAVEEKALLYFSKELDPKQWSCCYHQWLNRTQSPSLLLFQKSNN